jgi:hypothetical protein
MQGFLIAGELGGSGRRSTQAALKPSRITVHESCWRQSAYREARYSREP